jgi:flagellar FliL protein
VVDELEQQEQSSRPGIFKLILILVVLAALGAGGWFAWDLFIKPRFFDGAQQQTTKAEGSEQPPPDISAMEGYEDLVSLPPFVVNLADPLGRRYLKLSIDVEVTDNKAASELMDKESQVRDAIILYLSSLTYQDIQGFDSKILMKKELVNRLNQILGGSKVLRIYITEMVVQ